ACLSVAVRISGRRCQRAPAATRADASSRGWGWTARPGSEVRTTQIVSVAGSAHATVPVEPVCPKVFSEQPGLPAAAPTLSPRPRGVSPAAFWLVAIRFAVSGLTAAPRAYRNSARNLPTSAAEQCAPPQGAPSLRQYGLFQSQSFAAGSP